MTNTIPIYQINEEIGSISIVDIEQATHIKTFYYDHKWSDVYYDGIFIGYILNADIKTKTNLLPKTRMGKY